MCTYNKRVVVNNFYYSKRLTHRITVTLYLIQKNVAYFGYFRTTPHCVREDTGGSDTDVTQSDVYIQNTEGFCIFRFDIELVKPGHKSPGEL